MPVLDTEQWIEDVEVNGVMKPQILHSHYAKTMSNKFVIHKDSAISSRSKENILTADLTRIMRNVSKQCTNEERKEKVQEFVSRMQYSEYSKEERTAIYKKAKKGTMRCYVRMQKVYSLYTGTSYGTKKKETKTKDPK